MNILKCVIFIIAFSCLYGISCANMPWAKSVPFEPIQEFGEVRVPNGDAPVEKEIAFPVVERKSGHRVVLRFQARVDYSTPSGWNNFLGMNLNWKQLDGFTANGTPRVVNRADDMSVEENGQVSGLPYWKKLAFDTALLIMFGPGGDSLDSRVRSDREELYWYVVDVTDVVRYSAKTADGSTAADAPNSLLLSNNLLAEYIRSDLRDIILEEFSVGYVPEEAMKARWKGRVYEFKQIAKPAATLKGRGCTVLVGAGGSIQLLSGGEVYDITSTFSYPGEMVGQNALWEQPDKGWKVSVRKSGGKALVTAACDSYRLERTVEVNGHRVEVSDKLTNTSGAPVGVMVRNYASTRDPFTEHLFGGFPDPVAYDRHENPTTFLKTEKGSLGMVVEDDVFRLQLAQVAQPNRSIWKTEHFGLDAGKSYTLRWSLYPLSRNDDYWAFINQVREDWNVNYTIHGQWDFFHAQQQKELLDNPVALEEYVKSKNLKLVAVNPWLDYDNLNMFTGELVDRDEYKRILTSVADAFRRIDPEILVMGNIESFPIQLSVEDSRILYYRLPPEERKHFNFPLLSREMLQGLSGVNEELLESLTQMAEGGFTAEIYYRWLAGTDGRQDKSLQVPLAALSAYPAPGNAMQARLLDQARFLIKECGLDGLYIDCFTLAFSGNIPRQRYDYKQWDGHTVDVDPKTGRITRKYTDAGLVGGDARAELVNYVLKEGSVFVAHSFPVCRVEQTLPVMWFAESEWCFEAPKIGRGEKPPFFYRMCSSHLSTPLSLTSEPYRWQEDGQNDYARIVMKSLITYLRHGSLAYYYGTDIPKTGPGAGDYGPYPHMFPFTPVELHEGWVMGKERTITAVSGEYEWKDSRRPNVLVFDINGRQIQGEVKLNRTQDGWSVDLKIEDWENVAVIQ